MSILIVKTDSQMRIALVGDVMLGRLINNKRSRNGIHMIYVNLSFPTANSRFIQTKLQQERQLLRLLKAGLQTPKYLRTFH